MRAAEWMQLLPEVDLGRHGPWWPDPYANSRRLGVAAVVSRDRTEPEVLYGELVQMLGRQAQHVAGRPMVLTGVDPLTRYISASESDTVDSSDVPTRVVGLACTVHYLRTAATQVDRWADGQRSSDGRAAARQAEELRARAEALDALLDVLPSEWATGGRRGQAHPIPIRFRP